MSGGASELAVGGSTIFTCEHPLATTGTWTNEATVTGTPPGGPPIIHTSNKVVVKVPVEAFTVEKLQKIAGEFTKDKLKAKVGETVHYEIVVTNTGEATIKVESAVDVNCTNLQGPSKAVIAPGEASTYTCERTLTESGTFTNVAIVTGNEKPKESNPVVVEAAKAAPLAECTINEEAIVIHGGAGSKRSPFTIHVRVARDQGNHVPARREQDQDAEVLAGDRTGSSRCGSTRASCTTARTRCRSRRS